MMTIISGARRLGRRGPTGRPRRLGRIAGLGLVLALTATACGGSTPGGTTTLTSATTASPASTAPSTTATTTAPTTAVATTPTTSARRTVTDLERDLLAVIEFAKPPATSGKVHCDATGDLHDWQAIGCGYEPVPAAEYGPIYVAVLDRHRYTWTIGHCCAGGPNPEDYPAGLLCRDLIVPPTTFEPGRFQPDSDHLDYGLAVWYWLTEGRPDRMDADGNGIPCETVYDEGAVTSYWGTPRTLS